MMPEQLACFRCGVAKASVTEPEKLCGKCIIELMAGTTAAAVARKRTAGEGLQATGFLGLPAGAK